MKKQVIENFSEWIFEAAAPKKPVVPAGYKKTTFPEGAEELSAKDEVKKAKGWKALADSDHLQLTAPKKLGVGIASDKVDDFNKESAVTGVLVMSPSIYGREDVLTDKSTNISAGDTSFIVGFPYQREMLAGKLSRNITLSEKYVLFTPWKGGQANVSTSAGSGVSTGAGTTAPYGFRLIGTGNLRMIGIQSLLWTLGFNNSDIAKKQFTRIMSEDQIISLLKRGLAALSESSKIANANKSGRIIFDGYNALVSSPDAHSLIFDNFVETKQGEPVNKIHKNLNLDYLKKNLPLKTA
jgi:hypothetical protein